MRACSVENGPILAELRLVFAFAGKRFFFALIQGFVLTQRKAILLCWGSYSSTGFSSCVSEHLPSALLPSRSEHGSNFASSSPSLFSLPPPLPSSLSMQLSRRTANPWAPNPYLAPHSPSLSHPRSRAQLSRLYLQPASSPIHSCLLWHEQSTLTEGTALRAATGQGEYYHTPGSKQRLSKSGHQLDLTNSSVFSSTFKPQSRLFIEL